jgi:hypothetical protein
VHLQSPLRQPSALRIWRSPFEPASSGARGSILHRSTWCADSASRLAAPLSENLRTQVRTSPTEKRYPLREESPDEYPRIGLRGAPCAALLVVN